jgi:hypothetical protein
MFPTSKIEICHVGDAQTMRAIESAGAFFTVGLELWNTQIQESHQNGMGMFRLLSYTVSYST